MLPSRLDLWLYPEILDQAGKARHGQNALAYFALLSMTVKKLYIIGKRATMNIFKKFKALSSHNFVTQQGPVLQNFYINIFC
jgi:hypothetical protein